MSMERPQLTPAAQVPELDRLVAATGCEGSSIGAKGDRIGYVSMAGADDKLRLLGGGTQAEQSGAERIMNKASWREDFHAMPLVSGPRLDIGPWGWICGWRMLDLYFTGTFHLPPGLCLCYTQPIRRGGNKNGCGGDTGSVKP